MIGAGQSLEGKSVPYYAYAHRNGAIISIHKSSRYVTSQDTNYSRNDINILSPRLRDDIRG